MKIRPTEAWCAIGPDGVIDIDLIRRNRAGAENAAGQVKGQAWPRLAQHAGWRCVRVQIGAADDGEVQAVDLPDPPPPRRPARVEAIPGHPMHEGVVRFGGVPRRRVPEPT